MRTASRSLIHCFLCFCLLGIWSLPFRAHPADAPSTEPVAPQGNQADAALQQGRRLLRRGQAGQALGFLNTALGMYSEGNNYRGAAAAHNELGDLYLGQGQYRASLEHYVQAFQSLAAANSKDKSKGDTAQSA